MVRAFTDRDHLVMYGVILFDLGAPARHMKNWLVCGQGPKWKRRSRYFTTARRSLFRLWIAFFPIGEVVSLRMLEMLKIIDYQRFSLIFEGNRL